MDIKISPIFYNGCKKRILDIIIPFFPKEIDTFYDMFGCSGIVSMNVCAKKYFLNDIDSHLFELYNAYKDYDSDVIINHIQERIKEFGLQTVRTTSNPKLQEKYKPYYNKFRDCYNESHDVLDFITLCYFSFSQQFRFNGNKFNMPYGNGIFTDTNKEYIKNGCDFFSKENVVLSNTSIFDIDTDSIKQCDFVYLDPPYFNTTATYNEKGGWTMDMEERLLALIDTLSSRNIKWCMSNVFECKGKKNEHLIEWTEKHGYNVEHINLSYSAFGKGNSKNDEVLVCNYKSETQYSQLTLF